MYINSIHKILIKDNMNKLNIYIVHSPYLQNRTKYINTSIQFIVDKAKANGMETSINIVKQPFSEDIEKNISVYNERVKYDKEEGEKADVDFNNSIQSLNVKQISNIEKHRAVYQNIANENELHLVVEDDILIGESYATNIDTLFNKLHNGDFTDWDILFTCFSQIDNDNDMKLVTSRNIKKLHTKSSFFIRPWVSKKLFEYLTTFKYNLKTAISKFIWDNPEIKSMTLNHHTFLEGSKLGLFTSSLNASNFLHQNSNFVQLSKISTLDDIDDEKMKMALEIFEKSNYPENPDFLHVIGLIYFKRKEYSKATKYMCDAVENMEKSFSFIGKSSEMLNNAINMHQYEQPNMEEYKSRSGKYS